MPDGMTEKAIAAALNTKFEPAEMNGVAVSVKTAFEFIINGGGPSSDETPLDRAARRPIARVEVIGYRRFTREQIMKWISTRPGDVCDPLALQHDLQAILKTGYFKKERARVYAEEGPRGTLVIIFEVYELPLISGVTFEGLGHIREKTIIDALLKEKIDLRNGAVYGDEKIQKATRVIRDTLELEGQHTATVVVRGENTAFTVALTFVVSGLN
jgi:outer membrane protein assembly factor BamA